MNPMSVMQRAKEIVMLQIRLASITRGARWRGLAALVAAHATSGFAAPVACPPGGTDITQPPYAARADGSKDVSTAFAQAFKDPKVRTICLPPGEYLFTDHVFMRTGQELALLGLSDNPADVRITWKTDINPFHSSPVRGAETRIRGFSVKNVTFDGHGTDGRAFNLLAAADAPDTTYVVVENTVFRRTANLPVWIEGFSRVRIAGSQFLSTKDPGILRSSHVEILNNVVQDSSDNCLSVSRGNRDVTVARNRLVNCKSAGVFVGGINYAGNPDKAFELEPLAAMGAGGRCRLRSTDGKFFRYGMVGTRLTLRRGADFVILRIDGWDEKDTSQVPCVLETDVPPALVRKKTNEWFDGPHFGGDAAVIKDNVIEGSLGHGITVSLGAKDVTIVGNQIRDSGIWRAPDGQRKQSEAFGITLLGWYLGPQDTAQRYAEDIRVTHNRIAGATMGGMRLGSEKTGAVRDVVVSDNDIDLSTSDGAIGILVDRHDKMPTRHVKVSANRVRFAPASKGTIALRLDATHAEACRSFDMAAIDSAEAARCAISVGGHCEAARAPASLACR
ncbi:MAG: right-handed parallel beta-helix repeat-containing protein [Burkholderiales bacterium]|nr:right-handed parallel beta-helix repeat-containing protein [Burkholderiales bacterium]